MASNSGASSSTVANGCSCVRWWCVVLSVHEIESMRRSHAMAPLSRSHVDELLESCAAMAQERAAILAVLSELPASFGAVRDALNRLHRLLATSETQRAAGPNR